MQNCNKYIADTGVLKETSRVCSMIQRIARLNHPESRFESRKNGLINIAS